MAQQLQLPILIIGQSIIDEMVNETQQHPHTETGQALIGLETVLPAGDGQEWSAKVLMATIPDYVGTTREPGLFSNGGTDQIQVYQWYKSHWNKYLEDVTQIAWTQYKPTRLKHGTIPTGMRMPLGHLGDWHRHPGRMEHPSATDLATVSDMLSYREDFLFPILTYDQVPHLETHVAKDGQLILRQMTSEMRVRWWYSHRDFDGRYYQLTPIIIDDAMLPWLPPLPWHLSNPQQLQAELAALKQMGCSTRMMTKQIGDNPIHKVIFGVTHPNWDKGSLVIMTDWNYPATRPEVQVVAKQMVIAEPPPIPPASPKRLWERFGRWVIGGPYVQPQPVPAVPTWSHRPLLTDLALRHWDQLHTQEVISEPAVGSSQSSAGSASPVEPVHQDGGSGRTGVFG